MYLRALPVVRARQEPKPFLACCVPKVKFHLKVVKTFIQSRKSEYLEYQLKRLRILTEFHLIEKEDFKDLATLQPLTRRIQARKSTPTVASLPESKFSLVRDLVVDRSGVY